jgi:hypothetical protein
MSERDAEIAHLRKLVADARRLHAQVYDRMIEYQEIEYEARQVKRKLEAEYMGALELDEEPF